MSGSASIGLEQAILGHTLGFAPMAFPAQVFIALDLAALPPTEITGGLEPHGNGYARMPATFALIDIPANIAANVATVQFPLASAAWGTLGYFELWDARAGGNRLYWGALIDPATQLPTTITVAYGDIVRFSAGTLAVQAATGSGGSGSVGAYLPLAGGTLTGPLALAADPTTLLGAATKQYVDAHSGTGGGPGFLPLSGGTMLGQLTLAGNATLPLQAVPLQQVDTLNVVNVLNHGAKGDGTTDDTAAIQGVLNTYAGKATVFVPDTGHPYVTGGLVVPSGTDLLLSGTLQSKANTGTLLNIINGTSNVTVRGHGTIDCNGANQNSVQAGVYLYQASNVQVSGITVKNAFNWNVNVVQSSHVRFDAVSLIGGVNSNEFVGGGIGATDCWIVNSYISGVSNDSGLTFYGGVTSSGMANCTVNGAFVSAVGVYSDGAQQALCSNITIADNVFTGNAQYGINVTTSGLTAGADHNGIAITNNRCSGNGHAGNAGFADIYVDNCTNVVIDGNQSSAFGNSASAQYGIYTGVNATGVTVTGNQIYSTGQGGTAGVGLYVNSSNLLFAGANHFFDNQGTPTMGHAISGTAGLRNAYIGNFCDRPNSIVYQPDTAVEHINTGVIKFGALPTNAANDAAAATAGVPVSGVYRNGSALMVRVA